jgi:hypothetical protein
MHPVISNSTEETKVNVTERRTEVPTQTNADSRRQQRRMVYTPCKQNIPQQVHGSIRKEEAGKYTDVSRKEE